MMHENTPEEREILAALAINDPQTEAASREWVELVGLLACELEPVNPSVSVKARLFERLTADESADGERQMRSRSKPSSPLVGLFGVRAEAPVVLGSRWWSSLPLAAAVLLAVGLAAATGVLYTRWQHAEELVATLQAEVQETSRNNAEVVGARVDYELLRPRYDLVRSPGVKVCPLQSLDPGQPQARGTVFMEPVEGRWVLSANNLKPCALGRKYHLWFVTPHGVLHGGTMAVSDPSARVELSANAMPTDTRGVMVTLEWPDAVLDEPHGQQILFGEKTVEVY